LNVKNRVKEYQTESQPSISDQSKKRDIYANGYTYNDHIEYDSNKRIARLLWVTFIVFALSLFSFFLIKTAIDMVKYFI
jgi:hypothetical protein